MIFPENFQGPPLKGRYLKAAKLPILLHEVYVTAKASTPIINESIRRGRFSDKSLVR